MEMTRDRVVKEKDTARGAKRHEIISKSFVMMEACSSGV